MRILLVEDEAPLRRTLAARLKREGFAVDTASDGEEALFHGKEIPFDIAVVDLGLPKLSGMDVVKGLRDADKIPHHHPDRAIELAGDRRPEHATKPTTLSAVSCRNPAPTPTSSPRASPCCATSQ